MQLTFITLSILLFNIISSTAKASFHRNEDYKCRLATKTPYRCVANYDDTPFQFPGCTEKKIWLIFRHGTRYPGKKHVYSMIEELPKLKRIILENYVKNKTGLTAEDAKLLEDWTIQFSEDHEMKLTKEGEDEMIDLGERYQSRFPSLMPEVYDNHTYKFKYTNSQRTKESARYFAAGLFGWHNSQQVWYPEPLDKDPILRFYKRCDRWQSDVNNNPDTQIEKEKFLRSEAFVKALKQISEHIGHDLDYTTGRLMYLICAYETAWDKSSESPWCRFFSLENLKAFEFAEDLEYYWTDGYGYKLNYEQACTAIRDMFLFVSSQGPKVSAYFTHSGTILKVLALLGVARDDEVLKHDLFVQNGGSRQWKTSTIDTFATNIAFVLYDCQSGGPSVLFMLQEQPIYLSGCPLNVPCPISIMKGLYPDQQEECLFESMCQIPV